jgi:hypothetical protein
MRTGSFCLSFSFTEHSLPSRFSCVPRPAPLLSEHEGSQSWTLNYRHMLSRLWILIGSGVERHVCVPIWNAEKKCLNRILNLIALNIGNKIDNRAFVFTFVFLDYFKSNVGIVFCSWYGIIDVQFPVINYQLYSMCDRNLGYSRDVLVLIIDWLIMSMGWDYVSELRRPTGILFIPQVIYEHGEPWWNDIDRG